MSYASGLDSQQWGRKACCAAAAAAAAQAAPDAVAPHAGALAAVLQVCLQDWHVAGTTKASVALECLALLAALAAS